MIELQQKEINELQKKIGQMKRNFDSLSHYSASDKNEFAKLKNMKEEYEKQVRALKMENDELKKDNQDQREQLFDLKTNLDQTSKKLEVAQREVERLLDQLKKKEKMHEDKVAMMQSKFWFLIN